MTPGRRSGRFVLGLSHAARQGHRLQNHGAGESRRHRTGTRPAALAVRPGPAVPGADRRLPGAPDIVFPSRKVAVFVDGDFWHGAQWKLRGFASLEAHLAVMSNRAYWERKIRRNMERDRRVTRELNARGWRVVRLLESAINRRPARALARVTRALAARELKPS